MNLANISFTFLLALCTAWAQAAASDAAAGKNLFQPGYQTIDVESSHRPAPFSGTVFYPANVDGQSITVGENPVFQGVQARQNASVVAGRYPVVLLSHGLGGHTGTLGWLSAGLARRGVIVISVNHPDSTTRDFDMRKGLDHWTRVWDLQAALDHVADDPLTGSHMNLNSIHAAGFSFGGYTALSMGGLTGDLAGYAAHCVQVGDASTHCRDLARGGIDLEALDADLWNASYKDDRVKSVMAIDPGLLYGLQKSDVAELVDDVLLVGLGEGQDRLLATDFSEVGNGFAGLLPDAKILSIVPANHFSTFLQCKPMGAQLLAEEGDDPVCTDPEGTDRAALHAQVINQMAGFVGQ